MFDNGWPGGNSTARRQIKVLQITSTYESVSVIFSFNTKALDLCGPFILAKRHLSLCGFDRRPTVVWLLRTFIDRQTFSGDRHRISFVYFPKTTLFARIEIRILNMFTEIFSKTTFGGTCQSVARSIFKSKTTSTTHVVDGSVPVIFRQRAPYR